MTRAVIFDMDGLLTDSETVGLTEMHACGLKQGYDLPEEIILKTVGTSYASCCEVYHRYFPGLDTQRLFADFREAMFAAARAGRIALKYGARELLEYLRKNQIPAAVASSSSLETIRLYLSKNEVLPYFSALVSGRGKMPSKPAPDIFLEAARRLGAAPKECLVLEDSVNGIQAGRAAGMRVCMVPDLFPYRADFAPYCDEVKENLAEVIPLIEI